MNINSQITQPKRGREQPPTYPPTCEGVVCAAYIDRPPTSPQRDSQTEETAHVQPPTSPSLGNPFPVPLTRLGGKHRPTSVNDINQTKLRAEDFEIALRQARGELPELDAEVIHWQRLTPEETPGGGHFSGTSGS